MKKYATFAVLSAKLGDQETKVFQKVAHRADFDYEPRPGYLYVRSRAISSRCNDNYDEFPAEEIKEAYATFIGKPVFVNHHNDDHRKARGVIIDAALHEDANPDGSPDVWVEVLMEVDAKKFPKLAREILKGNIDRTSMGTDVKYSLCSFCGNKAATPLEYCRHIPALKGQRIRRFTGGTGQPEDVLVREICYGLGFFENSLLVEEPADPTAFFLDVDDRGLAMVASKTAGARVVNPFPGESNPYGADEGMVVFEADGAYQLEDLAFSLSQSGVEFTRDEGSPTGAPATLVAPREQAMPVWNKMITGSKKAVIDSDWYKEYENDDWLNPRFVPRPDMNEVDVVGFVGGEMGSGQMVFAKAASKTAIGETVVPDNVDTLRDSTCPICGEQDSYDGETCPVCNFVKPPQELMDPDLTKAKDLREQQDAQEQAAAPGESPDGMPQDFTMPGEKDDATEEGFSFKDPEDTADPNADAVDEDGNPVEKVDPHDPDAEDQAADAVEEGKDVVTEQEDVNGDHRNGPDFTFKPTKRNPAAPESQSTSQPEEAKKPEEEKDPADETDEDDDEKKKKKAVRDGTLYERPLYVNHQTLTVHGTALCAQGNMNANVGRAEFDEAKSLSEKGYSVCGRCANLFSEALKPSKSVRGHRTVVDTQESEMRTALRILAEQQVQLDAEKQAVSLIAAKLDMRPQVAQIRGEATKRVAALRAQADAENPAQPWPAEGTEAPAATTEETLGDVNADSVTEPGGTTEQNVAPDATTSVDSVGQDVAAPAPDAQQDVTKAVQGTDGKQPLSDVRTETEVRVKDGINTETAFPLEGDFATKPTLGSVPTEGRQFASLRLAKVRIAAGVAETNDDLAEATKIASSDLTDDAISSEVSILEKVVASRPAPAPQPRTAARAPQQQVRSQPSMAGGLAAAGVGSGGYSPGGDEFLFD